MPQFDGQTANIKVSEVSQKTIKNGSVMTKVTDEAGKKYSFFNKKKDGEPTAASVGFLGVGIGDVVEIGFKEEEKSFVGDEGKQISYTQRTILFANKLDNTVLVDESPNAGKVPTIKREDIDVEVDGLPF